MAVEFSWREAGKPDHQPPSLLDCDLTKLNHFTETCEKIQVQEIICRQIFVDVRVLSPKAQSVLNTRPV